MPKTLRTAIAVCALLLAFAVSAAAAPADAAGTDENSPHIRLTEKQQKEIAALYRDIMAKQKKLIKKYVEYGVISKEKGEAWMDKLEQRYAMLEQNGFVPNWKKCGKHHHRKSE